MTDDWEIDSHTLELRYRWPFDGRSYLEPHVRYYTQSHADFYRTSLDGTQALPMYASADYRLGEFDAITIGLKYGRKTQSGNEWSARLEYYVSDGSVPGELLIGDQGDREIYPNLDAIIAQFSYSFDW
jgi:outer membrane receptor for ferrienterochelin and colicin